MSTPVHTDKQWITRCFELARRGVGHVSPNPPVGAVLVHNNKILSEGYHPFFGGPHAEVQVFRNLKEDQRHLIPQSILYVSLEPCCIYSKTPPCTDLILKEGVKDVRVSILDPNPKIAGKGIEILKSNGVKVTSGILEEEGSRLISAFKKNILYQKPYIILKWAQSQYGFIGQRDQRIMISHPDTTTWSHSLRASADVILAGARTVITDNPKLTTRDAPGKSPIPAIYDPGATLSDQYRVFDEADRKVFYFSKTTNENIKGENIIHHQLNDHTPHVDQISAALFSHQTGILLVEGGSHLLSLFINHNAWDEAWVIRSKHPLDSGVKAPVVLGKLIEKIELGTDVITGILNE